MFDPTYPAALARLNAFAPKAGRDYASKRNYDDMAHVSALSPYIRHRIITEEDVLKTVLARHSAAAAEKFIQEVYWRTYWKGWLELRPAVWEMYRADLNAALNRIQTESGLRQDWETACKGETGIDCFDHWAQQLAQTGYLHNHARMWFASIWIHTLRLPWQLGADFFLRHLLDGDPASNTLSWRWVAGIQTLSKAYLATENNIATFTRGRFSEVPGLAQTPADVAANPHPAPVPLPPGGRPLPGKRSGVLLHTEDLDISHVLALTDTITAYARVNPTAQQGPWQQAPAVTAFRNGAIDDVAQRHAAQLGAAGASVATADGLANWARAERLQQIVAPFAPTGPVRDLFAAYTALPDSPPLIELRAALDEAAWPLATKGFFPFRKHIPALLSGIGI